MSTPEIERPSDPIPTAFENACSGAAFLVLLALLGNVAGLIFHLYAAYEAASPMRIAMGELALGNLTQVGYLVVAWVALSFMSRARAAAS